MFWAAPEVMRFGVAENLLKKVCPKRTPQSD